LISGRRAKVDPEFCVRPPANNKIAPHDDAAVGDDSTFFLSDASGETLRKIALSYNLSRTMISRLT
jgi:hypothetical protein